MFFGHDGFGVYAEGFRYRHTEAYIGSEKVAKLAVDDKVFFRSGDAAHGAGDVVYEGAPISGAKYLANKNTGLRVVVVLALGVAIIKIGGKRFYRQGGLFI